MLLWYVGCGHNIHSSSDLAIDLIINISTTGIYLLIVHAYSTNIIFTNQLIRCWVRWFMLYSPLYASLAAIRSRAMQCKTSNISNRIYSATCAMCIIQLDNHKRLAFTIYTIFFETRSTSVHIFFFILLFISVGSKYTRAREIQLIGYFVSIFSSILLFFSIWIRIIPIARCGISIVSPFIICDRNAQL